ncbi:MAG: MaoC family dehydratase N-terminal domain-containing protein [Spirochaetota bacterium]|nr:MaoC family dehydratase N-terminal domain-containing protein [Spirochaetota bacterium]
MANDDVLARVEELKKRFIGTTTEPTVYEVEYGAIKRFAQAVGDDNPLWSDDEFAKNTKYGSVICPPGFFGWPAKPAPMLSGPMATMMGEFAKAGFPGVLDGGVEFDLFIPIRPGDVLVSSAKVADIYEKEGKSGASLFGVIETTFTNQNGDVVTKARMTVIGRPA